MYIKLDDIIPNRFQPREVFDEDALNKLAESIKQHGVIEPILVRPVSNKYEIVAGERRYKASVIAGLTKIPAMVRQMDDKESSIVAFIENEHRTDVSAIEEARTMDRILKNNNMTQEELAKELGVNQSTIANKLRLLNLPLEVQESLMHNEISERHARSLLSVKDEDKQIELLNKIKERKMTVRELDSEIKNMNGNMNDYNEMNFNFNSESNSAPNGPSTFEEKKDDGFNPGMYFNNSDFSMPTQETKPTDSITNTPEENEFMSYLNNYETKEPVQEEPITLHEQRPNDSKDANDFRNFLNSYSSTSEEDTKVPEAPKEEPADDGFMSFLNNYDNNNPLPEEPTVQEETTAPEAPKEEPVDEGFMSFLNNYDNNNPLPEEPTVQEETTALEAPKEEPADEGFMSFLNNYDNNNPLPEEPTTPEEPEGSPTDEAFLNFLNNFDNNPLPPIEGDNKEENLYSNFNDTTTNNIAAESTISPISAPVANQYVENNENFVDISKQDRITNVDEIIDKLAAVVNEVKEKSVFKVETDEINYDDIYQITIRIDKRDF
jgi:ParB family chromosome partitioning protein